VKKLCFLTLALLFSGCLCCQNPFQDGEEDSGEAGELCPPPYIRFGADCCLDTNSNGVCDQDEEGEPLPPARPAIPSESVKTQPTATNPPTTTTTSTTIAPTTTTTLKSTYECAKAAGYDPDNWFYLYSRNCGSKYTDNAKTASSRKGVDVSAIDIGMLEDKEIALLECFYGQFYEGNPTFGQCPMMLCPKTGEYKPLTGHPVQSKLDGFALSCR